MAIQITREEYAKKYGVTPPPSNKPAPIKITHAEYVAKFVTPPEQKTNLVQDIAMPFARFGATAVKAGEAIGGLGKASFQALTGDKEGAQETLDYTQQETKGGRVEIPGFGKVLPFGATETGMKDIEGQTRDILGGGLQLASYATGNPALMGAVQGLGTGVIEDKSLLETAAYTAGGAVLGKLGEVAFKGAGKVLQGVGGALKTTGLGGQAVKEAAEESYARVLRPTTKINKALTKKITPELVERRITAMTKKGLLEQAESGVQQTGRQLAEAYDALPQNAQVAIDPVLESIGKAKEKLMMKAADGSMFIPPQNEAKMKIWQGIQDTITKLTANGQAELSGIREFRQLLDSGTYAKGLMTGSESAVKEVEAKGANILRSELAKQFPDIAVINREFNFWSNLRKVTAATIERQTGQAKTSLGGKIAAGAGAVVGGTHGGPMGAIEGATAFKWLHAITTSPAWETVSGATKGRIADLLSKGQTTRAGSLMLNIAERLGTNIEKFGGLIGGVPQVIKETPAGQIPGTKQITELGEKAVGSVKETATQKTLKGSIKNPLANDITKKLTSISKKMDETENSYAGKTIYRGSGEELNVEFKGRKVPLSFSTEINIADDFAKKWKNGTVKNVKISKNANIADAETSYEIMSDAVNKMDAKIEKGWQPDDIDWHLAETQRMLKKLGYDGADMTKANPSEKEILIWNKKALELNNKAKVQSFSKKANPTVGKTVDPLIQEAKKYKSAEEFVNGILNSTNARKRMNTPRLLEYPEQANLWLGHQTGIDYNYYGGLPEKITVYRAIPKDLPKYFDTSKLNPFDYVTANKKFAEGFLKGDKYSKVISQEVSLKDLAFDDTGIKEYGLIYKPAGIKDYKSQLTDIWNKANAEIKTQDPLIQEAKKYKSAEEFVKAQGTPVYRGQTKKGGIQYNETKFQGNTEGGVFFTPDHKISKKYGDNIIENISTKSNTVSIKESDELQKMAELQVEEDLKNMVESDELIEQMALGRPKAFAEYTKKPFIETGDKFGETGELIYYKELDKTAQTKSQLIDIWNEAHKTMGKTAEKKIGKEIITNKQINLFHSTNNNSIEISTNKNRLIPNSLSAKTYTDKLWGKNTFKFNIKKGTKILEIDQDSFFKFGKELDTPINRGIEIEKYAKKNGYDIVKIKGVPGVGTEYAIFNKNIIELN